MRLWHSTAATSAQFDDPNLGSCAGLVPVMRLAQDCALAELVAEQVTVAGSLGANTPHKIGCVVAEMIAGADSIDDLDLLRQAGLAELFDGVRVIHQGAQLSLNESGPSPSRSSCHPHRYRYPVKEP